MVGINDTVKWTDEVKPQSSVNIFLKYVVFIVLFYGPNLVSFMLFAINILLVFVTAGQHMRKEAHVANDGLIRNSDE